MQKGLVLASFGTTHGDTRRAAIGNIERYISAETGAYVLRAFTSRMIMKSLKERGLYIYSEEEAVAHLQDMGMELGEIFVQSLHLIPGFEYEKLLSLPVPVGPPLFAGREDLKRFVAEFPFPDLDDGMMIFFGHGSSHKNDQIYFDLDELCPERVLVVTAEGALGIENQMENIRRLNPKEIYLQPLMLVAGDHAKNDMASQDPDSLAGILSREGYKTQPILKGLGDYDFVAKHFLDKTKALMAGQVPEGEYL
ncbi:MAG: sirohydrochlorin cobaltochelatase [Tissierellia bacterium]|nr:sirohydrochlorin cobaltochelatase [Tissierellia bacterium]